MPFFFLKKIHLFGDFWDILEAFRLFWKKTRSDTGLRTDTKFMNAAFGRVHECSINAESVSRESRFIQWEDWGWIIIVIKGSKESWGKIKYKKWNRPWRIKEASSKWTFLFAQGHSPVVGKHPALWGVWCFCFALYCINQTTGCTRIWVECVTTLRLTWLSNIEEKKQACELMRPLTKE